MAFLGIPVWENLRCSFVTLSNNLEAIQNYGF